MTIRLARWYTVWFWVIWSVPCICILPFPFVYWYKIRVLNRSYIALKEGTLHLYQGRWFVLDDDVVYVKAIDHIKIDRSLMGYFFGWCSIVITTRNGTFSYKYMDLHAAEAVRGQIMQ